MRCSRPRDSATRQPIAASLRSSLTCDARAIERCFADPSVHTILIDPKADNTRAHRFYERLGFEYVAQREFCGDQCIVYRLKRPETPAT